MLDGDLARRYAVDAVPKFRRKKLLRRVEHVLGDDPGCDLTLRVQQAARLQQKPLGFNQAAGDGRHRFAFHIHGLSRRIQDCLEFGHRSLQRCIAGRNVGRLWAGDPALPIGIIEPSLHSAFKDIF